MSAETISAADLAAPTLETAPSPTPGMSAAPVESGPAAAPTPAAPAVKVDSAGVRFNASRHLDGFQKNGRWKYASQAKRGRPAAASSVPAGPDKVAVGFVPPAPSASFVAPDPVAAKGPDRFDIAAEAYLRGGYAFLDASFAGRGEWLPDSPDEHAVNVEALGRWLRVRNSEDLPPWAGFCMIAGVYGAKRIQRPNTNVRWRMLVSYWKARISSMLSGRKMAALPQVSTPAAAPTQPGSN